MSKKQVKRTLLAFGSKEKIVEVYVGKEEATEK